MADEKAPVTDSRFQGFNPEVEESHAQAAAAVQEPAAEPPVEPQPTHRCAMCGGLHYHAMDVCAACGATGHVTERTS